MDEVQVDDRVYATFDKYDEFSTVQSRFLELCDAMPSSEVHNEADDCLKKLEMIVRFALYAAPYSTDNTISFITTTNRPFFWIPTLKGSSHQ
jgi:hypothetical protein